MASNECVERQNAKKPIEIVGYGMQCPHCKLRYIVGKPRHCERCGQALDWKKQ